MTWNGKDYSIFVQSIGKGWVSPDDRGEAVEYKIRFLLALASDLAKTGVIKPVLSKPAETKIINAMEEHIGNDDLGGVWEVWNELDEDEKNHMNNCIDRNRRSRWKKAITAAGMMILNSDAPEPTFPEDFG